MATTATLTDLRARALDLADLTNSSSPVTARLDEYINDAGAELHDLLVNSFEDYYRSTSSISIVAGTTAYSIPSDFYKALKVWWVDGTRRHRVKRFQLDEMDSIASEYYPYTWISSLRYRILGSQIIFDPPPNSPGTAELWYAPQWTKLVNTSDTATVYAPVAWWEEYIGLSAAIKLRVREESDASQLMAMLERCKQRILSAAQERDAGEPQRVADVSYRFNRIRLSRR